MHFQKLFTSGLFGKRLVLRSMCMDAANDYSFDSIGSLSGTVIISLCRARMAPIIDFLDSHELPVFH